MFKTDGFHQIGSRPLLIARRYAVDACLQLSEIYLTFWNWIGKMSLMHIHHMDLSNRNAQFYLSQQTNEQESFFFAVFHIRETYGIFISHIATRLNDAFAKNLEKEILT